MTATDKTKPINAIMQFLNECDECIKLVHLKNNDSYSGIMCPTPDALTLAIQGMDTEKQGEVQIYFHDLNGGLCGIVVSGELKDVSAADPS